jgi:hypothetical protein
MRRMSKLEEQAITNLFLTYLTQTDQRQKTGDQKRGDRCADRLFDAAYLLSFVNAPSSSTIHFLSFNSFQGGQLN